MFVSVDIERVGSYFISIDSSLEALFLYTRSSHFSEKFGLYHVNFNDPARPRTPKESAKVLTEIMRTKQIPERFRQD
jgi:hypothetical protein